MTDIDTLIAEIDAAGAEREDYLEERLIQRALILAQGHGWIDASTHAKAIKWTGDGAYLSAAEVLVPEGWLKTIQEESGTSVTTTLRSPDALYGGAIGQGGAWESWLTQGRDASGIQCATPALSLTSASLKAHKAKAETPEDNE